MIFKMEGTSLQFQHPNVVQDGYSKGALTETAWARYQEGRRSYLTKHLNLCKTSGMNICKKCEIKYFLTANKDGACIKGGAHDPQYDFELSENVLECEKLD